MWRLHSNLRDDQGVLVHLPPGPPAVHVNPKARTIQLGLNAFAAVPPSLRAGPTNDPVATTAVDVKALFHHYFLSKYGDGIADPGIYEYEQMLTTGPDWRFRESGIGRDKESKRNASNELGKAFARWFLSEHLGFTYFAPLEGLIGKPNPDGSCWRRTKDGDLPDYVCGPNKHDVNLMEAKGRYPSLTFKSKAFDAFREQLKRVALMRSTKTPVKVKGFISVARWATEASPRVMAKLLVEDPSTDGSDAGEGGYPRGVGLSMVAGHYAEVFERLQLPAHAEALRSAHVLDRPVARRAIWTCVFGPWKGTDFVGGVIPRGDGLGWWFNSPMVLAPPLLFFGLESRLFQRVLAVVQRGREAADELTPLQLPVSAEIPQSPSVPESGGALSVLRDGSVFGPLDYFEPKGIVEV